MKRILIIILSGFLFVACEKELASDSNNQNQNLYNLPLGKGGQEDILENSENQLFINSNYLNNNPNGGGATFDIGQMDVSNTITIDGIAFDFSHHEPLLNIGDHINSQLLPVLNEGNHIVTINVKGVEVQGSIYNPKPVIMEDIDQSFIQIDRSIGLTLNWESDANNGNDKIAISLINRGDILSSNPTAPTLNSEITLITDDDGQYTITPAELINANFNMDDIIHIYVGRANVAAIGKTAVVYFNNNFLAGQVIK